MPPTARPDTRFTLEDFALFPDDGQRHEILVVGGDQPHILTEHNVQGRRRS